MLQLNINWNKDQPLFHENMKDAAVDDTWIVSLVRLTLGGYDSKDGWKAGDNVFAHLKVKSGMIFIQT